MNFTRQNINKTYYKEMQHLYVGINNSIFIILQYNISLQYNTILIYINWESCL